MKGFSSYLSEKKKESKYVSNVFVRYGSANAKRQKGFSSKNTSYHRPPASRGAYAFPLKAIELFLLSGNFQPTKFEQLVKQQKKFVLKDSDEIWHHLIDRVKPKDIRGLSGSWVKTTVADWKKAFSRESLALRYKPLWKGQIKSINEPDRAGPVATFSSDHLEIFTEKL